MKLTYISARGSTFTLSSNDYFHLIGIDGQTSSSASLSSVEISGIDGDDVTDVKAQPRSIVIDMRVKSGVDVEEAKRQILKVVKIKQRGTLEWEQNNRTVRITGVVEFVEMPRWKNAVNLQITLHCEQPFWEDVEDVIQQINEVISLHYFTDDDNDMLYFPDDGIALGEYDFSRTREVYNAGDVSVGLEIEIVAHGTVTNPIIYDTDNNFFGIGYGTGAKQVTMQSGDIITITTEKGKKTVKKNGVSLFDKIKANSTWLQLAPGDNTFSIDSDDASEENMSFYLTFKQRYI